MEQLKSPDISQLETIVQKELKRGLEKGDDLPTITAIILRRLEHCITIKARKGWFDAANHIWWEGIYSMVKRAASKIRNDTTKGGSGDKDPDKNPEDDLPPNHDNAESNRRAARVIYSNWPLPGLGTSACKSTLHDAVEGIRKYRKQASTMFKHSKIVDDLIKAAKRKGAADDSMFGDYLDEKDFKRIITKYDK